MTTSEQHAHILGVLAALSIACTTGNGHGQAQVDTALVYIQASGSSYNFPQVQDSSRILHNGSILPDPNAPPCVLEALPDTLDWPRSSSTWPLAKWGNLSIRLPPTFVPDSTPGRWEEVASPKSRPFPSSFMVLIGPMRGYPPSSFGGDVRQVDLRECKLPTPGGTMEVASYVVDWPHPAQLPTHYIAARSRLVGDTALLVLAQAHDSLTQAKFVAALRTLVLRPR